MTENEPTPNPDQENPPEFDIVGHGVHTETRQELVSLLLAERAKGKERLPEEKDKSEMDLKMIEVANNAWSRIYANLGLPQREHLSPDQVHILDRSSYRDRKGEDDSAAFAYIPRQEMCVVENTFVHSGYAENEAERLTDEWFHENEDTLYDDADQAYVGEVGQEIPEFEGDELLADIYDTLNAEQQAYLDFIWDYVARERKEYYNESLQQTQSEQDEEETLNRYGHAGTFIHESFHLVGAEKYRLDAAAQILELRRTGYALYHGDDSLFGSLNEAVVQKITEEELQGQTGAEVKQLLGLEWDYQTVLQKDAIPYADDVKLLDRIILAVATQEKIDSSAVWEKIKRGYFTGDIRHLRSIEDAIGPGALRLYSSLPAKSKALPLMHMYLETDHHNKRVGLSENIFKLLEKNEFTQKNRRKFIRRSRVRQ